MCSILCTIKNLKSLRKDLLTIVSTLYVASWLTKQWFRYLPELARKVFKQEFYFDSHSEPRGGFAILALQPQAPIAYVMKGSSRTTEMILSDAKMPLLIFGDGIYNESEVCIYGTEKKKSTGFEHERILNFVFSFAPTLCLYTFLYSFSNTSSHEICLSHHRKKIEFDSPREKGNLVWIWSAKSFACSLLDNQQK